MAAPPPLDGLPPEVIQEIALRACQTPFLGPPTALPALLAVSRGMHAALSAPLNPTFHARVFRAKFDTRAPARRFAAAAAPLTAACYADELRRRWLALRRVRQVGAAGQLQVVSDAEQLADLWLVYLMFLESDGKNYEQLLHWAHASGYVRTCIRDLLVPSSRPGYPAESTARALALWLMWFLTQVHTVVAEFPQEISQMHALLRPWALASHKYDTLCAPYTHWALPATHPVSIGPDPVLATPQPLADLDLCDRTEAVVHMGRRVRLAPPRAALAAIMAFMVRLERNGPIPARAAPAIPAANGEAHPGLTIYPRTRYPAWYGPGTPEFDGRVNRLGSAAYDPEWRRVLQCGNPFAVPRIRLQPLFVPGDLAGAWEGRFVFLTFDAFREMLAGTMAAVQTGPIAQQPHLWRIREHHLIRRRRRIRTGRPDDDVVGDVLPLGAPLDAYLPAGAELIHHGDPDAWSPDERRLQVRVPDPTSPDGFKAYYYTTVDGPADLPVHIPTTSVLWPPLPSSDMDTAPDWDEPDLPTPGWSGGDAEWEEEIVDSLVTGEGHSSWGKFILKGRVRPWDGMIILVKDYLGAPAVGRGRWLYKGYMVAGGNWVGRWRDTFTDHHLAGYEGVFSVTRRF